MNAISCSFTHKRLRFTSAAKLFQIGMLSYLKIIPWQKQLFLVIRKIIDQTHAQTWKNPSSAFSGHQKKFHLMQLKKSAKGMNSSD